MGVARALRRLTLVSLAIFSSLYFLLIPLSQAAEFDGAKFDRSDSANQQALSQEIIRAIEEGSIRKGALNAFSDKDIQAKLLAALDPSKIYFIQADLVLIQKQYPITTKDIESGKLDNLFKIYDLYQQHRLAKNTYDLQILKLGVEKLDIYHAKTAVVKYIDRPETLVQREERWSDLLSDEYLKAAVQQQSQDKVLDKIKERYQLEAQSFKEQTPENVYHASINALLSLYDERTQYLAPIDNENFSVNFNLVGIGIEFNIQDGYPTVIKSVEGAPAQGKLFPKDKITALSNDNKNFTELGNLALHKVARLLKGEKDTKVYLKVLPFSNPNTVTLVELTRKNLTLKEQEVSLKILDIKRENKSFRLGILCVPSFYFDFSAMQRGDATYSSATRDAWRLLSDDNNKNLDGLVIDLRDNGGGAFLEVANFFSLFQSAGAASYMQDMNGKVSPQYVKPNVLVFNKPLVVLVNRQSAGSTELFAAAMQDHQRGVVVGESTFGMGVVSSLSSLSSGALKVSVAKLYRPSGQPINKIGVMPDIVFPAADIRLPINMDSEPAIKVKLKAKKPNYSVGLLKAQHLKRIGNSPVFVYASESARQIQNTATDSVILDLNHRLKIAKQQRQDLEAYAKPIAATNEDVMQQLRNAELREAGEVLVDAMVQ